MAKYTLQENTGLIDSQMTIQQSIPLDQVEPQTTKLFNLISILSWISFCETMNNEERIPFPYLSFRIIDLMLKILTFDNKYLSNADKINTEFIVLLYNGATKLIEQEEIEYLQHLEAKHGSVDKILLRAIIHSINSQFVQIPAFEIIGNWLRLDFIIKIVIPKYRDQILTRGSDPKIVQDNLKMLIGSSIDKVYRAIGDLTTNLVDTYKTSATFSSMRLCKEKEEYERAVICFINEIIVNWEASSEFLQEISRLFDQISSNYNLNAFFNILSIPIQEYDNTALEHYNAIKELIPEIQPVSYRYENILKHYPIIYNRYKVVPDFFNFFACLREFPLRFNEYLDDTTGSDILRTLGQIYEFYLNELIEYALSEDRFIIIPEFEYNRVGSVVKSPDFVIIDKQKHKILVIEAKSSRTSNVVRDDPDNDKSIELADRIAEVLGKALAKIDEVYKTVGNYVQYKDEIELCSPQNTTIIYVNKDFGVLIPSLMHFVIKERHPEVSETVCHHNYCLMDIPSLENLLHNFKTTNLDFYDDLIEYYNLQVGLSASGRPVHSWIPIKHKARDTVYSHHLSRYYT